MRLRLSCLFRHLEAVTSLARNGFQMLMRQAAASLVLLFVFNADAHTSGKFIFLISMLI
jgi:hypothetical protein